MSRNRDPFFAGSPTEICKAEWFFGLWEAFRFQEGIHLRRIHYRLVSNETPVKMPGERFYENTQECWEFLGDASRFARHLGLVNPDSFEDHRNPDPQLLAHYAGNVGEPIWDLEKMPNWYTPQIDTMFLCSMPKPEVFGYNYNLDCQPYHLELWIEKTTMSDVLEPVCHELGINLVPSLGFQSITGVIRLLERLARLNKPTRIFYVLDFDPAGDGMPVTVSRHIEFYLHRYPVPAGIKLTPLALTREQVVAYRLPRIPIKESDRRKSGFETRHGEGAVELDALEALHPGELARIVREAASPYRDKQLSQRLGETAQEAERVVRAAWREATKPQLAELKQLEKEAQKILERHRPQLEKLVSDLAPIKEKLESVRHAVEVSAESFRVELPERPEAECNPPDESDWLFDSQRKYLEQIAVYKARKNGTDAE
jgi:hypothetical protein